MSLVLAEDGTLDLSVLPSQAEMLSWDTKWGGARGGTGSGKSFAWALWMFDRLQEYPRANHFVVGADFPQLRRGFFDTFVGFLEAIGWEDGIDYHYRESPSPLVRFLKTGAKLYSLSSQLAERIRSVEFQTLLLEEPQTWPNGEKVFPILVGRLRMNQRSTRLYAERTEDHEPLQPRGRLSFNPTDAAVGSWLHDLIEGRWPAENYPCLRLSVRDNYLLNDRDEYVHGLEIAHAPSRWASEIDGHWATAGGNVYREFDSITHCTVPEGLPPFTLDPRKPLLWTLDFNVALMCSIIAQRHTQRVLQEIVTHLNRMPTIVDRPMVAGWKRKILYVLGELRLENSGSPQIVPAFMEIYGDFALKAGLILYGDATGAGRGQTVDQRSSAPSNWHRVIEDLIAHGFKLGKNLDVRVPLGNPRVKDRVNHTNDAFRTAEGNGVLIDQKSAPYFVKDLFGVQWDKSGADLDEGPKKELTHLSDSFGYLVSYERRLAEGEKINLRSFANFMER